MAATPALGPRAARTPLLNRLFPWVHLAAVGFGAAGLGFGTYVYQVPWKTVQLELKRRSGELRSVKNQAEAHKAELDRLKKELGEVYAADAKARDGRRQADMRVIKAAVESRIRDPGIAVKLEPRAVRVRFDEQALFDARGPMITREGQARLQVLADIVSRRAARIRISAPMGGAQPPKWVRSELPSAADLSTARARAALRVLLRSGVSSDEAFAVVGGDGLPGAEEPSLDVEIEPQG